MTQDKTGVDVNRRKNGAQFVVVTYLIGYGLNKHNFIRVRQFSNPFCPFLQEWVIKIGIPINLKRNRLLSALLMHSISRYSPSPRPLDSS